MALSDLVKGLFSREAVAADSTLAVETDEAGGLRLSLPADEYARARQGFGEDLLLHQVLRMQILLEQGEAEAIDHGLRLSAEQAVGLDADSRHVFNLPAPWPGGFKLRINGLSRQPDFSLSLWLVALDGEIIRHYQLEGPLLKLGENEVYLPDSLQWQALSAVAEHRARPMEWRTEYHNLLAVHRLNQAAAAGLDLDQAAFEGFDTAEPEQVGLAVELLPDGGLELQPGFGLGLDQNEIAARLGQLDPEGGGQSLRVGKTLVLLDEQRLKAAHEIIRKRHIPHHLRRQFFAAPGSFIDASLVNLDAGFSLRIKGVGPFRHAYFGETGGQDINWFNYSAAGQEVDLLLEELAAAPELVMPEDLGQVIRQPAQLEDFKQKLKHARDTNAGVLRLDDAHIDISDPEKTDRAISLLEDQLANLPEEEEESGPLAVDIHLNDMEAEFGQEIRPPDKGFQSSLELDFSAYTRQPFPHQIEGIRWMLGLATNEGQPIGEEHRITGALLADDMGLGKTYMSIVGIREILTHTRNHKPVLVVAPLSLLENWKREVNDTYKTQLFKRIIILQADGDLPRYRVTGRGVEIRRPPTPKNEAQTEEAKAPALLETELDDIPPWEDPPSQDHQAETFATREYGEAETEHEPAAHLPEGAEGLPLDDSAATETPTANGEPHPDNPPPFEDFPLTALKIGPDWGPERLDLPDTLILTTYQTLRDYQFSLVSISWSVAVFDEAQNIKSPNTLQTRAAKALNADFKLLVTGTPVENHLGEFWCLFDTLQPGFLGAYQEFRQHYIKPILRAAPDEADQTRVEVGKQLRERVGGFMLRRIKEDHIQGLPEKRIILGGQGSEGEFEFDPRIHAEMEGTQRQRYEDVVNATVDSMSRDNAASVALCGLQQLRDVSLHPELLNGMPPLPADAEQARTMMQQSGKLARVYRILEEVREREEKVLIFAVNKRLQEFMAICINRLYGLHVPIINGETKAVSSNPNNPTRQGLIDQFQEKPGFGVLVISPVAAGVGLTITAANNVIHLERHWNPAKEAQATDRAFRIGQTRDVNVYIPILTHPDFDSFDVNLNRLLAGKTSLKDAIITQEEVRPEEFAHTGIFSRRCETRERPAITLADSDRLQEDLFVALWAELHARESGDALLTGGAHGCDVIVLDAGERDHALLRCLKAQGRQQQSLPGAEQALRELEQARHYHAERLNREFPRLILCSNVKAFNKKLSETAKNAGIQLRPRKTLETLLKKYPVRHAEMLTRNNRRWG